MKVRLNKETLAAMDPQVRAIVQDWKNRFRKTTISVEASAKCYIAEDARYTALNLLTGENKQARAAGEWAGATGLRPGAECPIPLGCVMIETGFFMGVPYLNIYQGFNAVTDRTQAPQLA
jgi:hypothetical protein